MSDPDFTSDERQVIGAIMATGPNAPVAAKAVPAIAARAGMSVADVHVTLRKLIDFDPPVVHRDTDASTGEEFWIALNEAAERLDPPDSSG